MSFETGMKLFREKDYTGATEQFHEVVEKDETNHKVWNALGVVLTKTGQYEDADTCYSNALTIAPGTRVYQRNKDKNQAKWQAGDVLEVEDDEPVPVKKSSSIKHKEEYDRFSNKFAIILAILGFLFGVIIATLVMLLGGIGAVFDASGAESLIGRSWVVIFLCFVGLLASMVSHKKYGSIILFLVGIFIIILISLGGIIPGLLFIIAGYLIFRETGFNFSYYLDFKSDTVKKIIFSVVILFCLILTIASLGSFGGSSSIKTNSPQMAVSSGNNQQNAISTVTQQTSNFVFSGVTHANVMAVSKSWDVDAENDGIAVYPSLLDNSDRVVQWSKSTIPVDIEVWTTGYDKNFKTVPETIVYSGSGTMTSWQNGNFILGSGIRIPFDQMSGVGDKTVGRTRVTIHLPNGKTLEATYDLTPLKP